MFTIREVAGWALIVLALFLVRSGFEFLETQKVVEASVAILAASFIFRGGIHLVKVASAANIALRMPSASDGND